jgi:phage tail sheath gpL-like
MIKTFDPLARASATSISFRQKNNEKGAFARQEIIVAIAQYQTGKTGIVANKPILSSGVSNDEGVRFGFGSPLHLISQKLFPRNKNGAKVPVYFIPLADDSAAEAATGEIRISGTATKSFTLYLKYNETAFEAAADACGKIATIAQVNPAQDPRGTDLDGFKEIEIALSIKSAKTESEISDMIVAELDKRTDLPFTYTAGLDSSSNPIIELVAKWKGADANVIAISAKDANDNAVTTALYGVQITTVGMSGGVGESDNQTALDNLTEEYEVTRIISQANDSTNLNQIQEFGEGLRDGQVSRFIVAYHGYEFPESQTIAGTVDTEALITLADLRPDDAVNIMIGGNFGTAIRSLNYTQRDLLLKKGIANVVKTTLGNYILMDCATFYHVAGVSDSIFAFDRDLCLIGNIANDMRNVFEKSEEWKSVVLVSDSDVTDNYLARSANDIKGAVNARLDLYGRNAWLTDIETAKENTLVEIDENNHNRVNVNLDGALSGVLRIGDFTNSLGFYFG